LVFIGRIGDFGSGISGAAFISGVGAGFSGGAGIGAGLGVCGIAGVGVVGEVGAGGDSELLFCGYAEVPQLVIKTMVTSNMAK